MKRLLICGLVFFTGCASLNRVKKLEREVENGKASFKRVVELDDGRWQALVQLMMQVKVLAQSENNRIESLEEKYDQAFSTKTVKGRSNLHGRRKTGNSSTDKLPSATK